MTAPLSRLMDEQPRPRIDGSIHAYPPPGSTCRKCGVVADDLTWIVNPSTGALEVFCFYPQPCYERAEQAAKAGAL